MATPTLDEFMQEVGPAAREAGASDRELRQYWAKNYGAAHIDPSKLPTWEAFKPSVQEQQPDLPEKHIRSYWEEHYGDFGAKEKDLGFSGTLLEGAKSTGRSLKAAAQTATGNLSGVEDTARVETEKDPALQKLLAEIQIRKNALGKDPSWWQSVKAVGGAVVDNPKGAAMLATEQLPNSAVALGSAGAGALAGSALGPAGTVVGGIAGLFIGNTAIETGSKAIEKGVDGFTPGERAETLREGAIKGGVVTGFDAATFGLTKWLTGTVARAMERATIQVLEREGIDTTNKAAVQAARQNPEIVAKVQQAQDTARAATNTLGKKLARGAGEVGSEAIGEGAGEYIGEVAATGKGDKVEAVIEALSGLGQSGAEIAIAQGMSRKQRQQGSFGDVTGQPVVTERKPEEMGMGQPAASTQPVSPPPATSTSPQASAQPDLFSQPAQSSIPESRQVSPLPSVERVLNAKDIGEAIAGSQQIVAEASDKAKPRAEEISRTTSPSNEAQSLPTLNLPSVTAPSLPIANQPEQSGDIQSGLAAERARMDQIREQQRLAQQANPVSEPVSPVPAVQPTEDGPLPSQADLVYPSSKQVRDLIHEKGLHLDTPVFREILKQTVQKEKFADLTPQELQKLAEKVKNIKAPQQPTQVQEAPPQVPLTPRGEKPYAPVTTIPEAQVPRSELTPEKNAEILLRAEKAKADMEIAGTERGGRFFGETTGQGSTQDVVGLKSATADWYKELTSGPSPAIRGDRKQSAREKIEVAIQKIIKDQGADRGKAVEQVKAALLQDQEFHRTEWGRDLDSILEGQWPSYIDKPEQPLSNTKELQAAENTEQFQNVPRGTPEVTVEEPKAVKVPPSRTERLKQQKQKMEAKKAEPSPSDAPVMESQPATVPPEREPAPPTTEAAPKRSFSLNRVDQNTGEQRVDTFSIGDYVDVNLGGGGPGKHIQGTITGISNAKKEAKVDNLWYEFGRIYHASSPKPVPEPKPTEKLSRSIQKAEKAPPGGWDESDRVSEEPFSLTAPEPSKAKAKEAGPEQLGIDIPPETIGSRPIIGREATLDEAPLFSKNAQTEDAEQVSLPEETAQSIEPEIAPAQSDEPAQSTTEPIDYNLIPEGTVVSVTAIRRSTGDEVTVQEDARSALKRIDESLAKYRQLLECVSA